MSTTVPAPKTDIAIVLGAAVWADETASPTLRRRAMHAAALYRDGKVGRIIGCGGVGKNPPSEAEMIRRICVEAGVPDGVIALEDKSTTTRENLAHAKPMMLASGCRTAVIVTDRYHALRVRLAARSLGLRATTSCPALTGTRRWMVARAYLREIPALVLYAYHHFTGR